MDPLAEYTARRDRFRAEEQLLQRRFITIGNWRLAIALFAGVLAWFVFSGQALSPWLLLVPLALFVGLVIWHSRVTRSRTLSTRALAFYERAIARVNDKWAGAGLTGERHRNPSHVYAEDLDLFGKGGLFDLIAITRTAAGEDKLASWLLSPAHHEEIARRQAAVVELSPNVELREEFALLASDVHSGVKVAPLSAWGSAPIITFPSLLQPLAMVMALVGLVMLVLFFAGLLPLWSLATILGCDFIVVFALRSKVAQVLGAVEGSARDIEVFSALVERLEQEQFESPKLRQLRDALTVAGQPASRRIRQLGRLLDWLDSTDHILVRIIRPLLLWREQLAMAFEKWRRQSGPLIAGWLEALAEVEALSCFATLAFERPVWTMPNLLPGSQATFEAAALKHPLIPAAECVENDLTLDENQRLFVVSGSNMSGKSTLLRAVGVNCVLASAGSPVAAASLSLSCLQIGASIRLTDSLQDHRSRFFAEISRIRQIVDLTKTGDPVLFLLDELLSGTNSHDRRIGAAGIVRELLRANSIGLITTHDLALANIQQDVESAVINVHFEDKMKGSEMLFDYKLKPGVVTRSNAIELMRAVGLEV